jgi:hypothetical protein
MVLRSNGRAKSFAACEICSRTCSGAKTLEKNFFDKILWFCKPKHEFMKSSDVFWRHKEKFFAVHAVPSRNVSSDIQRDSVEREHRLGQLKVTVEDRRSVKQ